MNLKCSMSMIAMLLVAAVAWADAKEDAKAMEGTWVPVSAELGGTKFPDEALKTMKLQLKEGKYRVEVGKQVDQGTLTLDPSKKPAAMDIKGTDGPNKDKTFLAIYELSGDSMKICYDLGGKDRPTEFKTAPKTGTFFVVYKREKP